MGRRRKLMVAVVGAVVLGAVLIVSTATADTAEGHRGSGAATCPHRGCTTTAQRGSAHRPGRAHHPGSATGGSASSGASTTTTAAPAGGGSSGTSTTTRPVTPTTTRPVTTTTAPAGPSGTTTSWWRPPAALSWQWELDHPLNLSSASDMGTGVATYNGTRASDPSAYDIDGFDNTAATVSALHARGDHVICYIEVGAAESYRPDYSQFPATDLGSQVSGYPSERYLNIGDAAVARVIEARIAMCATKGFDAIEPDIDDSYTDSTGFPITQAANVRYDTTLAAYAHSLGLAWGLKNGDDPNFTASMQPAADFALDEQCHQYDTCSSFGPFASAGKPVLEVEYSVAPGQFCPAANAANEDALKLDVSLSGGRIPCR